MRAVLLALLLFCTTAGGADPAPVIVTQDGVEMILVPRIEFKALEDAYAAEREKSRRIEHFMQSWQASTNCAENTYGQSTPY
jgi:hypothetical protein